MHSSIAISPFLIAVIASQSRMIPHVSGLSNI